MPDPRPLQCPEAHPETGEHCYFAYYHKEAGNPVHQTHSGHAWRDDGPMCRACYGTGKLYIQHPVRFTVMQSLECEKCKGSGLSGD